MKYSFVLLSIVCNYVTLVRSDDNSTKVRVDVYYETLCPDSIQFIRQKLFPTFGKVGDIMDINLVPYGKAEVGLDYCSYPSSSL